jgi:hypothetical protein
MLMNLKCPACGQSEPVSDEIWGQEVCCSWCGIVSRALILTPIVHAPRSEVRSAATSDDPPKAGLSSGSSPSSRRNSRENGRRGASTTTAGAEPIFEFELEPLTGEEQGFPSPEAHSMPRARPSWATPSHHPSLNTSRTNPPAWLVAALAGGVVLVVALTIALVLVLRS